MSATASRLAVLLFTDIVGSTDLKTRIGAPAYAGMLDRHNAIFESICCDLRGEVLKHTGDGFFAAFPTASDAVRAALRFQQAMRAEPWQTPVTSRVGIHVGEVVDVQMAGRSDVIGVAADVAAQVMSLAAGGQILLTRSAFNDSRQFVSEHPAVDGQAKPPLRWVAHGPYLITGIDEPIEVFEVGADGAAPLHAPGGGGKARRVVPHDQEPTLGWRPAIGLSIPQRPGWTLEKRLGEGGFGEVWLGHHERTKQHRVFKFCFDADRLRSFKRELTLFRLLREALGERPDIARLYEVKLDEPPFFLESEWTEGGNLVDWAEARGGIATVPLEQRLEIVAKVSDAVAAAHSVGILHKDIKPSNVLIQEPPGGAIQPRLADFGIGFLADRSQLAARHITETGFTVMTQTSGSSMTGTRLYSPPEVIAGKPFTTQGDIYALGVLLYQMAVGDLNRPLAEGWEREISDELIRQDIAWCCDGDPLRRPSGAGEIAQRIRALPQRREAARQKSILAETAERRHRVLRRSIFASVAMALLAVAVASSSAYYIGRVRAAQRAESAQRERAQQAEQTAKAEASNAKRLAAYANAQYFLTQGRVQPAFAQAVKAYELGGTWEDGYLLTQVVRRARQYWQPIATVAATETRPGCFIDSARPLLFVIPRGSDVSSYEIPSGVLTGTATFHDTVDTVQPLIDGGVLVTGFETIVRLDTPKLHAVATLTVPGLTNVGAHPLSPTLATVDAGGVVRVLDARTFKELKRRTFPDAQRFRPRVIVSPSGNQVAYHPVTWTDPISTWDWQKDEVITRQRQTHSIGFIDDDSIVGWFGVTGRAPFLRIFRRTEEGFGRAIGLADVSALTGTRMSTWQDPPSDDSADRSPQLKVALTGKDGLDIIDITSYRRELSTRYDSLWPLQAELSFAGADVQHGWLALNVNGQIVVFKRDFKPLIWMDFRTMGLCEQGVWSARGDATHAAATFTPLDPAQKPVDIDLGFESGLPWGLWTTPNGSHLAILRQQGIKPPTDNFGAMGSTFTDKSLVIYRTGVGGAGVPLLERIREIPLPDYRGVDGRNNRLVGLTPDGKVAMYGTNVGSITRIDVESGKLLGRLNLGTVAAISPDGALVAGDDADGIKAVDIATGKTICVIPPQRDLRRLCFSYDNKELWAALAGGEIVRYSLPGGAVLSRIRSTIVPIAVSKSGERFVGIVLDSTDVGTLMLGDSATGEPLLVLNANANELNLAFFHSSGRYLAIMRSRYEGDIIPSYSPPEAVAALTRMPHGTISTQPASRPAAMRSAQPAPVAPSTSAPATTRATKLIASTDIPGLQAEMGHDVIVQGQVIYSQWSNTGKVLNIELEGPTASRMMAVVFVKARPAFDKAFDGDVARAISGATIQISGTVIRYAGFNPKFTQRLEIILNDPVQLKIIEPAK